MKNGKGKIIYNNGDEYEGEWKNDQKNGEGCLEYINEQNKFKGEFENDMEKNGEGLIIKEANSLCIASCNGTLGCLGLL